MVGSPYRKIRVCLDFLWDNYPIVNTDVVDQAGEVRSRFHSLAGADVHAAIWALQSILGVFCYIRMLVTVRMERILFLIYHSLLFQQVLLKQLFTVFNLLPTA